MRKTKSILAVLSLTALTATTAACGSSGSNAAGGSSSSAKELVVAAWPGDISKYEQKYLFGPFSKETGTKVVVNTVPGGFAAQLSAQQDAHNVKWDLLSGPGADTNILAEGGRLQSYPHSLVSAIQPLVRQDALRPSASNVEYLSYGQAADVIVCNPARVKRCPTTPAQYFDAAGYPGARGMPTGTAVWPLLYALEAKGVPQQSLFPLDVNAAKTELAKLAPHIDMWVKTQADNSAALASGNIDMSIMGMGEAYTLKAGAIPKLSISWSGSSMLDSGLCVPKDAPHAAAAFQYIEWLVKHPEQQAKWTQAITYVTPAKNLSNLLPADAKSHLPTENGAFTVDGLDVAKQSAQIQAALQSVMSG